MRYIFKIILLILSIAILQQSSCKKKETPTYYIDKTFAKYVDFPVGSWWVYKDTISGKVDSVKMIYSVRIFIGEANPLANYEKLGTQYIIFNETTKDTIIGNTYANAPNKYIHNESIEKYAIMGLPRLYYPFTIGNNSGYQYGPSIASVDSIETLNGIKYKNVVTTHYDSSGYGNALESVKYAEGVGVIYRKFFNGKTSILINYKIK
ncbi:MAG: hypothetical protein NTX03_14325 [Bacteroidetes bacterium]|nr:hypothetical protein [Bacteroidota bacterium]